MLVGAVFYIALLASLAGRSFVLDQDVQDTGGRLQRRLLWALLHAVRLVVLSIPPVLMLMTYGCWAAAVGLAVSVGLSVAFIFIWRAVFRADPSSEKREGLLVFVLKGILGLYVLQLLIAAILLVVPMNSERCPVWKGAGPYDQFIPFIGIVPMVDPNAYYIEIEVDGKTVIYPVHGPPGPPSES